MISIDFWSLGFLAFAALLAFLKFLWREKKNLYPIFSLSPFPSQPFWSRSHLFFLRPLLFGLGMLSLSVAILNPHSFSPVYLPQKGSQEGIALFLVLDRSGSMNQRAFGDNERKIDLLKEVTAEFVKNRPNDLIGLATFARTAEIRIPLTLDRKALENGWNQLRTVQQREEDGTAIGYAIYKTAHILAAMRQAAVETKAYDLRGAAMIVVTDGFQDPNPLDRNNRLRSMGLEEAARFASEQEIRLYIINIDPKMGLETYAPERRLLEKIATETGGLFFLAPQKKSLRKVYQAIDEIEKSTIPAPVRQKKVSYAIYFLWASLGFFALAFLCKTIFFRSYPR